MAPLEHSLHARPLPDGWTPAECLEDSVVVDGVELFRAGWASTSRTGLEVTGSAADREPESRRRAHFELLERIATVEAIEQVQSHLSIFDVDKEVVGTTSRSEAFPESEQPERWRFARSNGVALHRGWEAACDHARAELVERDRVLRSWYGGAAPILVEVPPALATAGSYDWQAFVVPASEAGWCVDVVVAGVVGFPKRGERPLVMGYGAAKDHASALAKAEREALQSLAFLWDESVPSAPPPLTPSALGHLEWWLYPGHHELLRRWLAGENAKLESSLGGTEGDERIVFVDLTPSWLSDDYKVVKALSTRAAPLKFGDAPTPERVPDTLRVHPIV